MRLPEQADGSRAVSYETVRRIRELGHNKIGDTTADALATMLEVSVDEVLTAAGQRKRLGPFRMPRRAERLNETERAAVLGVVDAILNAADADRGVAQTRLLADVRRDEMAKVQKKAARRDRTE